MKKIIFIITLLLLTLSGCKNKENISTPSNAFNNSDNLELSELKYYYNVFELVNVFYEDFQSIGNSIDANKEDLTIEYMNRLKNTTILINNIKTPKKFKESHNYLKKSITQYINGLNGLIDSYDSANYKSYKEADKILLNAGDEMKVYLNDISESTSDYASFLDNITQINYYLKIITMYDYNKSFTENENESLYILERNICNFVKLTDEFLKNSVNNKNNDKIIKSMNDIIHKIENQKTENSYINNYKNNTVKNLKIYIEYLKKYENQLKNNTLSKTFLKELNLELQNFGLDIYDNLENISQFYSLYNIDLGFKNSKTQINEYNQLK